VIVSPDQPEPWTAADMIAWARAVLGLTVAEIAAAFGVTAATVRRWERGGSVPYSRQRTQFDALIDLRALVNAVFATPTQAQAWLQAPFGSERGNSPQQMFRSGAITPLVDVLATIEFGAFL
jgi:transcriptional regulator with XRE-family HTH domain